MQEQDFVEIEVVVKVDADGDYEIGRDLDDAGERFSENCTSAPGVLNTFVLKLKVPLPKPIELEGITLPASSGKLNLEITQA